MLGSFAGVADYGAFVIAVVVFLAIVDDHIKLIDLFITGVKLI